MILWEILILRKARILLKFFLFIVPEEGVLGFGVNWWWWWRAGRSAARGACTWSGEYYGTADKETENCTWQKVCVHFFQLKLLWRKVLYFTIKTSENRNYNKIKNRLSNAIFKTYQNMSEYKRFLEYQKCNKNYFVHPWSLGKS